MNPDRMSRRSLLGTGALLTIEKAIDPRADLAAFAAALQAVN